MMLTHHTSLVKTIGRVDPWREFNKLKTTHVPQGSIVGVTEMKVP
jgi:hypothetical protein